MMTAVYFDRQLALLRDKIYLHIRISAKPVHDLSEKRLVAAAELHKHPAHTLPRTRRRPAPFRVLPFLVEQTPRTVADEAHYRRMDVVRPRPGDLAFDVLLHLDLQKAVGEGGRHRGRERAVFRPVGRRADVPPVRNLVELAEPPVEN